MVVLDYCGKRILPGTQGPQGSQLPLMTGTSLHPSPTSGEPPFVPPNEPVRTPVYPDPPSTPDPGTPGGPGRGGPATPGTTGPGAGGPAGPGAGGPAGPATGPRGPAGPATGGPAGPGTGSPAGPATGPRGPTGPTTGPRGWTGPGTAGPFPQPKPPKRPTPATGGPGGPATGGPRGRPIEEEEEEEDPPLDPTSDPFLPSQPIDPGTLTGPAELLQQIALAQSYYEQDPVGTQVWLNALYEQLAIANQSSQSEPQDPTRSASLGSSITERQDNSNADVIDVDTQFSEAVSLNADYSNQLERLEFTPKLLNPELNFFKTLPNDTLVFVENSKYPSIFRSVVASEVKDILSYNSTSPWNEFILQNLSNEKILQSLSTNLLRAFQSIRTIEGKPVGLETFLNVVRKHLMTGTLDEFDPGYYIGLADSQSGKRFTLINPSEDRETSRQFALDFIRNNSISISTSEKSEFQALQANRLRPLNEDMDVQIYVQKLDGTVIDMFLPNEGIPIDKFVETPPSTVPSIGSPNNLNIGDGGGYYLYATLLTGSDEPLFTTNSSEVSYFVPPSIRLRALDLMEADKKSSIIATSNPNQHEYVANDSGASYLSSLYFGINLSSVEHETTDNPFVEQYSATYSMITQASDIAIHVNNNALNSCQVCIDYRDPIYRYILDTSSFTFTQQDITYRGFSDRGFQSFGERFVSNIPFTLIVTPVSGSDGNPFYGRSSLITSGSSMTRKLDCEQALQTSIDGLENPLFEWNHLNNRGETRIGIGEPESDQNIEYIFNVDNLRYWFANQGTINELDEPTPAKDLYGAEYVAREVIDYLNNTYSPTELTWYDIYTRMPYNKVGELFYDDSNGFLEKFAKGGRSGINILDVEGGYSADRTRVLADDDKTIISRDYRKGVNTYRG